MRGLVIGLTVLVAFCSGYQLLSEDFNSVWTPNNPPTGWRVFHTDTTVEDGSDWHRVDPFLPPWTVHTTPYASVFFTLTRDSTPDSLVSPSIDCSGYREVTLRCSTFFWRRTAGGFTALLAYSTDGGASFTEIFNYALAESIEGEQTFLLRDAANQPSVLIAWIVDGNMYNFRWWCVDDVTVDAESIPPWDIACVRILNPPDETLPGPLIPQARFRNRGINDQFDVPVECRLYDSGMNLLQAWSDVVDTLLALSGEKVRFFNPPYPITAGDYYIEFWTQADSDYVRSNDTLGMWFKISDLTELYYDNDTLARLASWPVGHYGWGAKFTPAGYPVYLESAKVFLDFPANPAHCGYQIAVARELGSVPPEFEVYAKTPVLWGTPSTRGWNSVFLADTGEQLVISSGDFYLFYLQVGEPPECPSIGVDAIRNAPDSTYWQCRAGRYRADTSSGDFMIRAVINHTVIAPAASDIRTLMVDWPWYEFVQRPFDAPLTPRVRIDNNGAMPSLQFTVACSIFGAANVLRYADVQQVLSLDPTVDTVVTFLNWVPDLAEPCSVIVCTQAPVATPDLVPQNDYKRFTVDLLKGVHAGSSLLGYNWLDSDTTDGPVFNWIDTSGAVPIIASGDEIKMNVPLYFGFPYYDTTYDYITVSTNGWLTLGIHGGSAEPVPRIMPDPTSPNRGLYAWWDDLAVGNGFGGGQVFAKWEGVTPNRRCVIIWQDACRPGADTTDLISFEIVLNENGTVVYQYNDVTTDDPTYDNARYAAIGSEDGPGFDGLCYLYARPPMSTAVNDLENRVAQGRAILFYQAIRDAAALEIVSPEDYTFPGIVIPSAKIQNYGTVRDTIWAYFSIGSYAETAYVDNLRPGDSTIVFFPPWTCSLGVYTAKCVVEMFGDTDSSNNVVSKIVVVSPWIQRTDVPEGPRRRRVKASALCYAPNQSRLYALKGSTTNEFWFFDIATGTWDTLPEMPLIPSNKKARDGCNLAFDPDHGAEGYIWALKGGGQRDFYAFDIAADSWLTDKKPVYVNSPDYRAPKVGAAIDYVPNYGAEGTVFCIPGNNSNLFWQYDIAADSWGFVRDYTGEPVKIPVDPLTPKKCKYGSDLVYGHNDTIYALKGNNTWECYGFDVNFKDWVDTLDQVSLKGLRNRKVKSGGSMVLFNHALYLLKGGNTQEFWRYTLGSDSLVWHQLTDIPLSIRGRSRKVKRGSAMAGADSTIFCLKGSYSYEFWEYKASGDTADLLALGLARLRQGVMAERRVAPGEPGLSVYPNPARSNLLLTYNVPAAGHARIRIYDGIGSLVRTLVDAPALPGRHQVRWDGLDLKHRSVSAGVYFVKMELGPTVLTRKLVLQR